MGRKVGVVPPRELARRANLFRALGAAFDITFEGREAAATAGLNGVIAFPGAHPKPGPFAILHVIGPVAKDGEAEVRFAGDAPVDRVLRGRTMIESRAPAGSLAAQPQGIVLASCNGRPVWLAHGVGPNQSFSVVLAPEELARGEPLADRLRPGRFLALLPLIEFLRNIDGGWTQPPLRAAFIFDDPNLHSGSYGHIDYRRLGAQARRSGFHAVMATIPHDLTFASRPVVELFIREKELLSLTIHGNDHVSQELLRERTENESLALAAQALARTVRFEKRTGLEVSRVMCAPFEVCSEQTMRAVFRTGFEALAIEQVQLRAAMAELDSLLGFLPADRANNGLPVVPRHRLDTPVDQLVLSAFLRRPLFLYGHHADVARGYERLAGIADLVNSFGDVSWAPLSAAARGSYAWRLDDGVMIVRLHGRVASIETPEPVGRVVVRLPGSGMPAGLDVATEITSLADSHRVRVEVRPRDPVDAALVAAPRWSPWPTLRRTATELRDRASAAAVGNLWR